MGQCRLHLFGKCDIYPSTLALSLDCCCCEGEDILTESLIAAGSSDQSTTTISPLNSHFMALACRDTVRLIFQKLTVADLARASCVCRVWNSVATENDLVASAFTAPWRIKELVGKPVSGAFWRDNGIWKFAISHRISRGDSVTSLAVKYSVQVVTLSSSIALK